MSRQSTPEDWRRAVFRSATLSDRTKVLLLFMADRMRQDRRVSVPREEMARGIGKSERRVTERVTEAHDAGWLDTVMPGRKRVTAVYIGLFPDVLSETDARPLKRRNPKFDQVLSGTPTSPLRNAETRPLRSPNQALRGRASVPPIEERTCSVGPRDPDVGSDEEAEETEAVSRPPVCTWHDHEACPDDCANHPANRGRTA